VKKKIITAAVDLLRFYHRGHRGTQGRNDFRGYKFPLGALGAVSVANGSVVY